jgi:SAM-dependent methyltransferase
MSTDTSGTGSAARTRRLAFIDEPHRVLLRRLLRPAPRGLLMRTGPVSRSWGFDRGLPIDRYFIETFLDEHRRHISGRVLEVKDDGYTRRFGATVRHAEVLDIDPGNPAATVVADLADAPQITDASYDCLLLTQVLHQVYDLHAAVAECRRILRPGGTLLATMPSVSRCSSEPRDTDYWRITPSAADRLFGDVFGTENVEVEAHGNAVLGASFLMGVAVQEVPARQLRRHDPRFPVLVTIRATRAS